MLGRHFFLISDLSVWNDIKHQTGIVPQLIFSIILYYLPRVLGKFILQRRFLTMEESKLESLSVEPGQKVACIWLQVKAQ